MSKVERSIHILSLTLWLLSAVPLPVAGQFDDELNANEISARLAELSESQEKDLPDDELALFDERRRIEDELPRYRRFAGPNENSKESFDRLEKLKNSAIKLLGDVDALDCSRQPIPNYDSILSQFQRVSRGFLFVDSEAENPWQSIQIDRQSGAPETVCQSLKAQVQDSTRRQALIGYFDIARKEIESAQAVEAKKKEQVNILIQALQKRRESIQQKLREVKTQTSLSGSLWIVILVIGGLSIAAIFVVKFFPPDLQVEWVASGQVIQFVTVMILLSVIMALGLAGILKENTLGTLLGGIAGYVLSQGVGRSAAREISRRLNKPLENR